MNYDRTIRNVSEGRPIDALLAAHAAKTLAPALAALVAAHLELKRDNRAYVAALEAVHGVFLEELKPVPLAGRDRRLVNIFASPSLGSEPALALPASDRTAVLPRALRRLAGCDSGDLPWHHRAPGVKEVILRDNSDPARFVCVRPGLSLPIARQDGVTVALVLAGAATDGTAFCERGDIIFAGPDVDGVPTVEGDNDCICFVVAEAPAKGRGPLSRMLHLVKGG